MEAIVYLHSKGVYYGNMQPLNIEVFDNYFVKLTNFNLAIKIPTGQEDDF